VFQWLLTYSLFSEKSSISKLSSYRAYPTVPLEYMYSHAPVIIFMAIAFQSSILPPLAKFLILTLITLPLTFAITYYVLKRIPLINKFI